jgi:uncharacterized protein (TIGR02594 family)
MEITAYDLAQRFIGVKEVEGLASNPMILSMLKLDDAWPEDDSVPWCSAFVNYVCWLLRLPRSKSLAARSWLGVGLPITMQATVGFDIVVFSRGETGGHVGFYAGQDQQFIQVLGGNQSNSVRVSDYPRAKLLGIRRLA